MTSKISFRSAALKYLRVYRSASGGWVDLHPLHGEAELPENMEASRILADHGFKVELLPLLHNNETDLRAQWLPDVAGNKNPDIRINRKWIGDFKSPEKNTTLKRSCVQRLIYSAANQKADIIIINLFERQYAVQDIKRGVIGALQPGRNKSIQSIWLITRNRNLFTLERPMIFNEQLYDVLEHL